MRGHWRRCARIEGQQAVVANFKNAAGGARSRNRRMTAWGASVMLVAYLALARWSLHCKLTPRASRAKSRLLAIAGRRE